MAIPLIAWGVGLALLLMGGDAPPKKKEETDGGGPNAAPPEAAPFVSRIQRALLAMGFTGDGELKINGRLDTSTGLALQEYWRRVGGFVPLSYAQLAVRLEAELAGKPAPSMNFTPPTSELARAAVALSKLGFATLEAYFLAKGEFPSDMAPQAWAVTLARLEAEAGTGPRTKAVVGNIR